MSLSFVIKRYREQCDHARKLESQARDLTGERDKARLLPWVCDVCWTSSFVPIEAEAECDLSHPHEGNHARCDMCWLQVKHRELVDETRGLRDNIERFKETLQKVLQHREHAQTIKELVERQLAGMKEGA